jgi:hypothetical protein
VRKNLSIFPFAAPSRSAVRNSPWRQSRTAPDANHAKQFFTVTHPFHPWCGRRFELIDRRQRWGQWRVYYVTENGCQSYFPASWTDVGPIDPFVEQARGRAVARVEDLLQLASAISKLSTAAVNEIKPHV